MLMRQAIPLEKYLLAYAYAEVCGDVSGNLLAVSIFADSLVQLGVILILRQRGPIILLSVCFDAF